MILEMKLTKENFEQIYYGQKLIEVRLYDEKRRKIKKDQCIKFNCLNGDNYVHKFVQDIKVFNTFKELYDYYDVKMFGDKYDKKQLLENIYKIYTKKDENKYGVVAIELESKED